MFYRGNFARRCYLFFKVNSFLLNIFFARVMFLELRKIIPLDGPSAKSSRFANLSKQERSQLVEQRHSGKTKGKNKQTNKLVCINLSNFRRSVSL